MTTVVCGLFVDEQAFATFVATVSGEARFARVT